MLLAKQHLSTAGPAFVRAVGDANVDQASPLEQLRSSLNYDLVMSLAIALLLGALALLSGRRRRWVRVMTWCLTAVFALALAFGIGTFPDAALSPTGLEPPEIRRTLQDLLIGWYSGAREAITLAQLVALAAVAVLLFGDAAADFYTRPASPDELRRWRYPRESVDDA